MQTKKLILRLSSLGDIILATSILQVKTLGQVDWVIAQEFVELVEDHPRVNQVFPFNRKSGLRNWIKLCHILWTLRYEEIYDLHQTVRTRIMKLLFIYWSFKESRKMPCWKTVSKQRIRLWSYFLFKDAFPKVFRPTKWITRFVRLVNGDGSEKPDFFWLTHKAEFPLDLLHARGFRRNFLCIMPSSFWNSKKWPVHHYLEVIQGLPFFPIILGTQADTESYELVQLLSSKKIPHYSAVGKWSLAETAKVLSKSVGYLGGDTGLAHLAEAVGVPARIIFGPTSPDMGFGPWRKESQSISIPLICRPCSSNGKYCYRFTQKYHCLKDLSVQEVLQTF